MFSVVADRDALLLWMGQIFPLLLPFVLNGVAACLSHMPCPVARCVTGERVREFYCQGLLLLMVLQRCLMLRFKCVCVWESVDVSFGKQN